MALDAGLVDAVVNSNFKLMAERITSAAADHNQRLQILAEKGLAKSLESMDTTSVTEGLGLAAAQRGDVSKVITELGSAIASLQQVMKGAQTTPPPTA